MNLDISTARFAPMRRLLSGEDESFLIRQGFHREAAQLRSHHRKLFFRFVDMLEKDFSTVHEARKAAMAGNWDFETLLKERFTASYYLWAMRTAGYMHLARLPQAAEIAKEYCDRLQSTITDSVARPVAVASL
ncbi:MAG TPA: hypothetical protein VGL72_23800 [Bryobacteraceae bacterium]